MAQLQPPPKQERISQILPTVKCSSCNHPVPISELGEHICAALPKMPTPPPAVRPSPSQAILAKIRMEAERKTPSPPARTPPPPTVIPPIQQHSQVIPQQERVVVPPSSAPPAPVVPMVPSRSGTPMSIRSRTPVPPPAGPPPHAPLPPLVIPPQGFNVVRQRSPAPRTPVTPRSADSHPALAPPSASRVGTPISRTPQHQHQYANHQTPHQQLNMNTQIVPPQRTRTPLSAAPLGPPAGTSTGPQRRQSPAPLFTPPVTSAPGPRFPPTGTHPAMDRNGMGVPAQVVSDSGEVNMAGVGRRAFQAAAQAAMLAAHLGPKPSHFDHQQKTLNEHWNDPQQPYLGRILAPPVGMDGRRNNAPRHLNIDSNLNGTGLQGIHSANSLSPSTPRSYSPRSPASHPSSPHSAPRIASSRTPSPLSAGFREPSPIPPLPVKTPDSARLSPGLPEGLPARANRSRSVSPASSLGDKPKLSARLSDVVGELAVDTSPLKISAKKSKDKLEQKTPPSSAMSEDSDFGGLAYDNDTGTGSPNLFSPSSPPTSLPTSSQSIVSREPTTRLSQERSTPRKKNSFERTSVSSSASQVRFPSKGSTPSSPASPQSSRSIPLRSFSSSSSSSRSSSSRSSTSSRYSRGTTRSTGALPPSLDTLFENPRPPPSPPAPSSSASPPAAAPSTPSSSSIKPPPPPLTRGASVSASAVSPPLKSPKLPTRSRTAPTLSTPPQKNLHLNGHDEGLHAGDREERPRAISSNSAPRPRQCTRCSTTITDGRWVPTDIPGKLPNNSVASATTLAASVSGGGVLCEGCWKMMYLPKCRRCGRAIEKQAVSSADGQLKGKYHRECFTCFRCHKPFPDKEFYVFDGKPFCAYHYHEANDSLCADCGHPIEGACAVAHSGARYHPEHLLCQYEFPPTSSSPASGISGRRTSGGSSSSGGAKRRCREPLAEYWEVEGMMLCERHALLLSGPESPVETRGPSGLPGGGEHEPVSEKEGQSATLQPLLDGVVQIGGVSLHGGDSPKDAADARRMRRKTQFIDLR